MPERYHSVDFEVFGRVQGVFFRQYTCDTAKANNLVGWVQNTAKGTVKGTVQGLKPHIDEMKHFLSKVGSPHSHIARTEFKNQRELVTLEYNYFQVTNTDW